MVAIVSILSGLIQAPQIVARLELRIPDNNLTDVGGVAESASHVIAVSQPSDHLVRFYSYTGKSLGTFGRLGNGPGDFRYPQQVYWTGDSLSVIDTDLRRLVVISSNLKLIRTIALSSGFAANPSNPDATPALQFGWPFGVMPSGEVVSNAGLRVLQTPRWQSYHELYESAFVRSSRTGTLQRLLMLVPSRRSNCTYKFSGGQVSVPECNFAEWAVAPSGERLVLALGETSGGRAGRYRVTSISGKGDTLFDRTYPFTPELISGRVADSIRAALVAKGRTQDRRNEYAKVLLPSMFRPITKVLVGSDSTTWVGLRAKAGRANWVILGSKGDVLGTITLPASVELITVNLTTAYGVDRDSDDVETIVRYRIRRTP